MMCAIYHKCTALGIFRAGGDNEEPIFVGEHFLFPDTLCWSRELRAAVTQNYFMDAMLENIDCPHSLLLQKNCFKLTGVIIGYYYISRIFDFKEIDSELLPWIDLIKSSSWYVCLYIHDSFDCFQLLSFCIERPPDWIFSSSKDLALVSSM